MSRRIFTSIAMIVQQNSGRSRYRSPETLDFGRMNFERYTSW